MAGRTTRSPPFAEHIGEPLLQVFFRQRQSGAFVIPENAGNPEASSSLHDLNRIDPARERLDVLRGNNGYFSFRARRGRAEVRISLWTGNVA